MMPKMPRMFGANITSMLMKVSRIRAMAMWRNQLKDLVGNNICWMARRTCGRKQAGGFKREIIPQYRIYWGRKSTNLQGTTRWGRSEWQRWGQPLAHTGSKCHMGRSGCKCEAVQAPHGLQKHKEKIPHQYSFLMWNLTQLTAPFSTEQHIVTTRGSRCSMCKRRSYYWTRLFSFTTDILTMNTMYHYITGQHSWIKIIDFFAATKSTN